MLVPSSATFPEFLALLSSTMELPIPLLPSLAYQPLWKTKRGVEKLLDSNKVWTKLVSDVQSFRDECAAKNRGKGIIKEHTVLLIDKSVSGGGKDGKKGKKEALDEKTIEGNLKGGSHQKETECLQAIEAKHMCSACKVPCRVLSTGEHHQYSLPQLSMWAHMMVCDSKISNNVLVTHYSPPGQSQCPSQ